MNLGDVINGIEPWSVQTGDVLDVLKTLPDRCVQCVCTSPPYFGLRDYGHTGQIGLEPTPQEYVAKLVEVFREVRQVLRDDGVLWLNLGDSYAATTKGSSGTGKNSSNKGSLLSDRTSRIALGFKPKDRLGIPHRVVFALQEDGWYWRDEIIFSKRSPMPESVTDRCTKAHEMVFMLTKKERYFYDQEAIREPLLSVPHAPGNKSGTDEGHLRNDFGTDAMQRVWGANGSRNRRSVWTISSEPFPEAHFATWPSSLVEPMILAGTSAHGCCSKCGSPYARITEKTKRKRNRPNDYTKRTGESGTGNSCANSVAGVDTKTLGWEPTCKCKDATVVGCIVLDPFTGSGTTGMVARQLRRRFIGSELNPEYADMARRRVGSACPLDDAIERNANSESKQTTFFPDD